MNNIAVIPARGGSKRLLDKNIMMLGGIPLIAHSILEAQKHSDIINDVYVSTDNPGIKAVAHAYGAKVIDRPAALSGDFEPTVTALKHVLENVDSSIDTIFLLQATNPLRPADLISEAWKLYINKNADSLMTVTRNHQKFGKITNHKFIPFNYTIGQRSQDLEPLYFENGLLYIIKSNLILNEQLAGENHIPMIVDHPFAKVDIDIQEDFDYAEYLLQTHTLK